MDVVIVLDGSPGSRRSIASEKVAKRLGLSHLDTGAMYWAVTRHYERHGIDLDDPNAVAEVTATAPLDVPLDPSDQKIMCDGVDATQATRESEFSRIVSKIVTNLHVHAETKRRQCKAIAAAYMSMIVEGKGIATVAAPDTDICVLLTAPEATRLARRVREIRGSDDVDALEATRGEVPRRDAGDSTVSKFMTAKNGVTEIDSLTLGIDEAVETIVSLVLKEHR